MTDPIPVRFANYPSGPTPSYRLLELPLDLCKSIESNTEGLRLTIKGKDEDDAVLCTRDRTWDLRAITVSNTFLIVTARGSAKKSSDEDTTESTYVQSELSQVLEIIPIMAKVERLRPLLRDSQYDEQMEDGDSDEDEGMELDNKSRRKTRYTMEELRPLIQASDEELEEALKRQHILEYKGTLRQVPIAYLAKLLVLVLNTIVSSGMTVKDVPVPILVTGLEDEHQIPGEVTRYLISWFGEVKLDRWNIDREDVVRHVGLGLLSPYKHATDAIHERVFIEKWREAVGDAFEDLVDMSLLRGYCLTHVVEAASGTTSSLQWFPRTHLPSDPLTRFNDLFLVRPKWKAEDMEPFLEDIAVDKKEREKFLMKFTRVSTDDKGNKYYTARANHV